MLCHIARSSLAIALLIGLLAGCQISDPGSRSGGELAKETKTGAAKPSPEVKIRVPESIAGAKPAAATATPPRSEPRGKFIYGYHVAISPAWFDPSETPSLITPWAFLYALHDGLVKHLPGKPFAPSLAESYQIPDDARIASFRLREGITFHNGDPITPEDVIFSFENYHGANAKILHDKTERIEIVDNRTLRFHFKEPFFDFLVLYGSPASGAGWIIPKKYYERVGPDGFKQKPIGAGPYKFVRFSAGGELELTAFTDYWRKSPSVKTLIFKEMVDDVTRLAALQTGEADAINLVPGQLINKVKQDPQLRLAPTLGSPWFLEFVGWQNADNPFHDSRVRQAASLALDRKAMMEAETAGLGQLPGSWIPDDWPGALAAPEPKYDLARAKQLMSEAGYPNGFEVAGLTPVPPYTSRGERVATALREIGIRTKVNTMERAAFATKITEGPNAFKGIILNASGAPGDAANRVRAYATCRGSSSRMCVPAIEEKFTAYEKSADAKERERLLNEVQQYLIDEFIFPAVYRLAFVNAVGPRLANPWEDVFGSIPQYVYLGPYEDVRLKE